jgi:CDGSH-type Zn-finger protein
MVEVIIKSEKDGPNVVFIDGKAAYAFCRCGQSMDKPFCDGTHHQVDFQADEKETKIQ